mmetsp:Transcript_35033/g.35565  ORF Transcript_35033/g.35565 Transcript_35033/m.35565 type:complete len:82 (-) Transcript_35033:335-580(-)
MNYCQRLHYHPKLINFIVTVAVKYFPSLLSISLLIHYSIIIINYSIHVIVCITSLLPLFGFECVLPLFFLILDWNGMNQNS